MSEETISRSVSGRLEYEQAIDEVLSHARRSVRVFDANLGEGGWNSAQRYETLRQFLLGGRGRTLHVVLHDIDHVNRHCPRLLNLLRQYSETMAIHQTLPEARSVYDPMVLVDDAHYVHRFHFEQPRAELALHASAHAHGLHQRFDEIWQASVPAVAATVLGL